MSALHISSLTCLTKADFHRVIPLAEQSEVSVTLWAGPLAELLVERVAALVMLLEGKLCTNFPCRGFLALFSRPSLTFILQNHWRLGQGCW